jgi:hypothetical protein
MELHSDLNYADWYWHIAYQNGDGETASADGYGVGELPEALDLANAWCATTGVDPESLLSPPRRWQTKKGAALYGGENRFAGGRQELGHEALCNTATDLERMADRRPGDPMQELDEIRTVALTLVGLVRQLDDYLTAGGQLPRGWAQLRYELRGSAFLDNVPDGDDDGARLVLKCTEHSAVLMGLEAQDDMEDLIGSTNRHVHAPVDEEEDDNA